MSIAPQLRDYQESAVTQTLAHLSEVRTVGVVLPARSGKTVVIAELIRRMGVPTVVIAHRTELLSQASAALADVGIRHRVIGSKELQRDCVNEHLERVKRNFIDPTARVAIASVGTLKGCDPRDPFIASVRLALVDEMHHLLQENSWGKAIALLSPESKVVGLTATFLRADGKGLGLEADGLVERLVIGPSPRELIQRGFICPWRPVMSSSGVDLSGVALSSDGDFNQDQVRKAVHKNSRLVGDVVKEYQKRCAGLRGMTFCVDVDAAVEQAEAFRAAGVPAEVVTGKTPGALRTRIMQAFKNREVLQLVNVDLFGEGVNVPGMEVVSMARPTASFGLFVQQAFRPLTFAPGKKWGWIIDHVENFDRHGAPDVARDWAKYLKRRERTSRNSVSDTIPTRTCLHVDDDGVPCAAVYERTLLACPICGTKPVPVSRGGPEQVDGDLFELDPEALRKLFGEIARIDGAPVVPYGADRVVQMSVRKAHAARQDAQAELRRTIALWAGWQMGTLARSQAESYRRFFFRYGRDVATACTLGAREAEELRVRIQADLDAENVVDSTVISA